MVVETDIPPPIKTDPAHASFLRAAKAGNFEKVLDYLKSLKDINVSNANGLNALHLAAKEGHADIVRLLIKKGANVNSATVKGNTALHIASLGGHLDVVKIICEEGANLNCRSKAGFTPLYMAAQEDRLDVVKHLLSKDVNQNLGTDDGFTPLAVALQQGHDRIVSILLQHDSKGKVRLPPLHIAAKKDDVQAAYLLLSQAEEQAARQGVICTAVDQPSKSGFTALHIAAHYGNENMARLLIQHNAQVNHCAKHLITPLHVAAKWGQLKIVELLVNCGSNVTALTRDGLSALHCAARSGHAHVVQYLLYDCKNASSSLSSKQLCALQTKNGLTPLHMAAQGDHCTTAEVLLNSQAYVDDVTVDYLTALHVACHCGHVSVAQLLLENNADVNARALNGFTPLHIACKKNRVKVVELLLKENQEEVTILLLERDANLNATSKSDFTPLHLAAKHGSINIAKLLIAKKALINAQGKNGLTALHVSAHYDHSDIALLLLSHGSDAQICARNGYSALHIAAKKGQLEICIALLEYGCSVHAQSKAGFTPLHLASQNGHLDVVSLLVQQKADVNAKAKNGLTPLHLCAQEDRVNIATILVKNKCDLNPQTKSGYTPLHVACHFAQHNMIQFLLNNGAELTTQTSTGYTPLHQAAQQGHTQVVSTLLNKDSSVANRKSSDGHTALRIAQRLGYMSVVSTLIEKTTETMTVTETTEESRYRVEVPEQMHETFISDSEDEHASLLEEEPNFSPSHYMMTESYMNTLTPDNVDLAKSPTTNGFLVSFLVDARGGAMRGCRHSGIRILIPPRKASQPMRITCKYVRKEKLLKPPPLMENEECASRILELSPSGVKFLGPVIIEIPHFASLRDQEREILILRSDNGETWKEHNFVTTDEALQEILQECFEGEADKSDAKDIIEDTVSNKTDTLKCEENVNNSEKISLDKNTEENKVVTEDLENTMDSIENKENINEDKFKSFTKLVKSAKDIKNSLANKLHLRKIQKECVKSSSSKDDEIIEKIGENIKTNDNIQVFESLDEEKEEIVLTIESDNKEEVIPQEKLKKSNNFKISKLNIFKKKEKPHVSSEETEELDSGKNKTDSSIKNKIRKFFKKDSQSMKKEDPVVEKELENLTDSKAVEKEFSDKTKLEKILEDDELVITEGKNETPKEILVSNEPENSESLIKNEEMEPQIKEIDEKLLLQQLLKDRIKFKRPSKENDDKTVTDDDSNKIDNLDKNSELSISENIVIEHQPLIEKEKDVEEKSKNISEEVTKEIKELNDLENESKEETDELKNNSEEKENEMNLTENIDDETKTVTSESTSKMKKIKNIFSKMNFKPKMFSKADKTQLTLNDFIEVKNDTPEISEENEDKKLDEINKKVSEKKAFSKTKNNWRSAFKSEFKLNNFFKKKIGENISQSLKTSDELIIADSVKDIEKNNQELSEIKEISNNSELEKDTLKNSEESEKTSEEKPEKTLEQESEKILDEKFENGSNKESEKTLEQESEKVLNEESKKPPTVDETGYESQLDNDIEIEEFQNAEVTVPGETIENNVNENLPAIESDLVNEVQQEINSKYDSGKDESLFEDSSISEAKDLKHDKEEKTLEQLENYIEIAKSKLVEINQYSCCFLEFAGNFKPVVNNSEQLQLKFEAFRENRLACRIKIKNLDADLVGRVAFMREKRKLRTELPQTPICNLNIILPFNSNLPEEEPPKPSPKKELSPMKMNGLASQESFKRKSLDSPRKQKADDVELHPTLVKVSNELDRDWTNLASHLNLPESLMMTLVNEPNLNNQEKAANLLKYWQNNLNPDPKKFSESVLENALRRIGREDIIFKSILNINLKEEPIKKQEVTQSLHADLNLRNVETEKIYQPVLPEELEAELMEQEEQDFVEVNQFIPTIQEATQNIERPIVELTEDFVIEQQTNQLYAEESQVQSMFVQDQQLENQYEEFSTDLASQNYEINQNFYPSNTEQNVEQDYKYSQEVEPDDETISIEKVEDQIITNDPNLNSSSVKRSLSTSAAANNNFQAILFDNQKIDSAVNKERKSSVVEEIPEFKERVEYFRRMSKEESIEDLSVISSTTSSQITPNTAKQLAGKIVADVQKRAIEKVNLILEMEKATENQQFISQEEDESQTVSACDSTSTMTSKATINSIEAATAAVETGLITLIAGELTLLLGELTLNPLPLAMQSSSSEYETCLTSPLDCNSSECSTNYLTAHDSTLQSKTISISSSDGALSSGSETLVEDLNKTETVKEEEEDEDDSSATDLNQTIISNLVIEPYDREIPKSMICSISSRSEGSSNNSQKNNYFKQGFFKIEEEQLMPSTSQGRNSFSEQSESSGTWKSNTSNETVILKTDLSISLENNQSDFSSLESNTDLNTISSSKNQTKSDETVSEEETVLLLDNVDHFKTEEKYIESNVFEKTLKENIDASSISSNEIPEKIPVDKTNDIESHKIFDEKMPTIISSSILDQWDENVLDDEMIIHEEHINENISLHCSKKNSVDILYTLEEEEESRTDDLIQGEKDQNSSHLKNNQNNCDLFGVNYNSSADNSNSLNEFERLEQEVDVSQEPSGDLEKARLSTGQMLHHHSSLDSIGSISSIGITGTPKINSATMISHPDAVSINSLTEFERLENEFHVQEQQEKEVVKLTEIEEGHESQASDSIDTVSGNSQLLIEKDDNNSEIDFPLDEKFEDYTSYPIHLEELDQTPQHQSNLKNESESIEVTIEENSNDSEKTDNEDFKEEILKIVTTKENRFVEPIDESSK
ncbi:hypothetical protein RND71_044217 [Anisodus tanguticus]|uniref:Ankyrin-3 n=1 Tax=Anisodus tanguticus TaxID=243964 RepID=A0AAE1UQX3_9SOLA|nr:hypothetical protein RND71_044217 [Anisodus tanguticus]